MRAGICTPVTHSVRFKTGVPWLKKLGVAGVVIWPRVLFGRDPGDIPQWLFRHELEHVYQILRVGPLRFYFSYFLYSLRYGYRDNPYEIEARKYQGDPLTPNEKTILWKLNEDSPKQPSPSLQKSRP